MRSQTQRYTHRNSYITISPKHTIATKTKALKNITKLEFYPSPDSKRDQSGTIAPYEISSLGPDNYSSERGITEPYGQPNLLSELVYAPWRVY